MLDGEARHGSIGRRIWRWILRASGPRSLRNIWRGLVREAQTDFESRNACHTGRDNTDLLHISLTNRLKTRCKPFEVSGLAVRIYNGVLCGDARFLPAF